ncbi:MULTISPECIES: deoxyribose-phosphate aldolase [Methanobrevibacter]|uniref:Deoxyribose-phosphate aldolase n=1 Tax=Methanobrevibacter gottschalkii DSM 11977 TaxID=1122229 RepID=A0A3N5BVX8_9EURY|nr:MULTISPECIES: deoxyribose-phosphate aldolase [Methanobrevibacter]OEC96823.1 deoxyribose-phosphate aldolase [Methanobrevibacter sp. A27]RPF51542.1 deoxyribose-phosphate aldolase [Methanobrevibacter gottschalkii DSM 11977]
MTYNIKNSKELAGLINYTNLNNIITESEMVEFLEKAKETNFNSVVVSPTYVKLAKETLKDTNIKVGSVIGFPLGFEDTESKVEAAKSLLDKGVDEFEVVLNLSYLKDEKYELLENEIKQIKEAIGDKVLKVIIETKALEDYQKANAAKLAEKSGADYVKTSTGFVSPSHIFENVNDINIIQKHAPTIKIEIYGGINNYKFANQILTGGADVIGSDQGYEIVKRYKDLRENTQVKPKPITL